VFLPRIVLGQLSTAQMTKYFTTHGDYVKSLRPISLAPFVTNLDTIRDEFYPTGEVVKRTTREWATSIMIPSTGVSARCDIVNGGADQSATLLVPSHVYLEVQAAVSQYKLRLNPLARREARFLDNIPGLPEVIHIDMSVQQSLDCLEFMSSEDIWKSGHQPTPAEASRSRSATGTASQAYAHPANSEASQLSGPTDDTSLQDTSTSRKKKKSTTRSNAWGLASTASTQSVMTPSIVTQNQEYIDLERLMDTQQAQLDKVQEESVSRWNELTQQVQANQATQTGRFDDLERKVTKTMKCLTSNNASMASLQEQFTAMMGMLTDLTKKESRKRLKKRHSMLSTAEDATDGSQDVLMYPIPEVPPIANAVPSNGHDTPGSDTEDIYSAPLQTAAAVPAILESSNKKRSANDFDQQDDMSDASKEEDSASQISGVSQLLQDDESEGSFSDDASLSSEYQRLLNADTTADEPPPTQSNSPPLDAQYNNSRDPAGGDSG
jgi:hypothetical protein